MLRQERFILAHGFGGTICHGSKGLSRVCAQVPSFSYIATTDRKQKATLELETQSFIAPISMGVSPVLHISNFLEH